MDKFDMSDESELNSEEEIRAALLAYEAYFGMSRQEFAEKFVRGEIEESEEATDFFFTYRIFG